MPPSPHMSQRTVPMKDNSEHRVNQLRGEDLHCKCCCDLGLEETMARVSGERAPAFTSEELEKIVDWVLPQYTLLYSPPDKQVTAHQKKDIWRAIAKDVRTLGVYHRRRTHCRKRWKDIRRWSKKTAEAQLGMASQLVPVVTGIWSAPATRAASVARSHSTDSPPPVKHQTLASARRERGKSAVTPSKAGKGHKKPGKSEKSSTAEKTAIIPAAQEATASTNPAAQEATTSTSPAAQEPTTSPAAQEATASTSPAAQEATASTIPAAQEATASTSPAAQEATTSTSPAAQEATSSKSPLGP
ncbi:hypothetical protein NDU88_006298 [Pleurodeles waltl]|uniref:Myb/SANT-like DNA-binding domain-containing protein n=1 Tax=Pleurodeles waltl TaxID=8319 RepID=A0AAV7TD68_PLEWA|nr:hypothetical protein NDU88_006298 [Pleurodeles waltl]